MKKILILGFPSLNNYGTGMMGLITIQKLNNVINDDILFFCDFFNDTDMAEICSELDGISDKQIDVFHPKITIGRHVGLKTLLSSMTARHQAASMDLVVILGGDDISEYYHSQIWRQIADLWHLSREVPVVLLGQTIGPFRRAANRMAARHLMPAMHIFPRDQWCVDYLRDDLKIDRSVTPSTDLAYADLPLQHRADIRDDVLSRHGLAPDGYATLIVSGLGSKYYTPDLDLFLDRHAEMAIDILNRPDMAQRKICLLAHTHGSYYGDEAANILAVRQRLGPQFADRLVVVTDRILQTRARFILGNGLFTVTGRMHPAVSTFQMGKPAITLSYSKKYEGVIGTMLGRSDLIIEANDSQLWESGDIRRLVGERVSYAMANHERLCADIRIAIARQKETVDATFVRIARLLGSKAASARHPS